MCSILTFIKFLFRNFDDLKSYEPALKNKNVIQVLVLRVPSKRIFYYLYKQLIMSKSLQIAQYKRQMLIFVMIIWPFLCFCYCKCNCYYAQLFSLFYFMLLYVIHLIIIILVEYLYQCDNRGSNKIFTQDFKD